MMLPKIITYTYAYQPEGSIIEHFLESDVFRAHYENEQPLWVALPLTNGQVMDLIDEYTRENSLDEDQRGTLVAWFHDLESGGTKFVAVIDRY